jgi:hypothetical protein
MLAMTPSHHRAPWRGFGLSDDHGRQKDSREIEFVRRLPARWRTSSTEAPRTTSSLLRNLVFVDGDDY